MYKATFHEPVEWHKRPTEDKMMAFKVTPEFHEKVKDYCDKNQLKVSQLIRYALAKEINGFS